MKKYLSILIAIVALFTFAACSGAYTRKGVSVDADIRDYAVISNGGSAVQYGRYIYFINGHRGYEDESGNENVMGKVVKGGLYRTKLADFRNEGGKIERNYSFGYGDVNLNVFAPSSDAETSLQFEYTKGEPRVVGYQMNDKGEFVLDEDDEKIPLHYEDVYNVDAELITPKTVGTSGYKNGGIFIYDNYIFFASPNNNKNRENNVQYNKTDFYVSTLSGSETRKLYTTQNDSSGSEYAFYKYGGNYYLVVHDGKNIVSVSMNSKGKIEKPVTIAENVASVLFPTKDVYYNFSRTENGVVKTYSSFEYTAEDFIYFTREANKNDSVTIGQVMEMLRPNGTQGLILSNDGGSVKLLNTDNGVLFYEVSSVSANNTVKYSNLHNILLAKNSEYATAYSNAGYEMADISGYEDIDTSAYTAVRCLYPSTKILGAAYIITFGSSVSVHSATGSRVLYTGTASFTKVVQNRLYFVANDALQYVDIYENSQPVVLVTGASSAATYMYDILDEYVVFFKDEDEYLKSCAKFKNININADNSEAEIFIGQRAESEEIPE